MATCPVSGLKEIIAPIIVGDRHVATWVAGQVRNERPTESLAREMARKHGLDEETLVAHFRKLPTLSDLQFGKIGDLLLALTEQLARVAHKNLQLAATVRAQRSTEGRLRRLITEKDQLMKELNHRVKNNLAMVSSLISLKSGGTDGEDDLSDIRSRIDAIQALHDALSHGDGTLQVDLRDYVGKVVDSVVLGLGDGSLTVRTDVPQMWLAAKSAVTLGLIVNELVTNAVKHGLDDAHDRRVIIRCSNGDDGSIIRVANTGTPPPPNLLTQGLDTLGLRLVYSLAEGLGGSITMETEPMTAFSVCLPPLSTLE